MLEKKSSDHLYLEKLTFSPELKKTWLNFFVTNFRVVILMIFLITLWGIYSFQLLPRESNPEVKIPIATIITTYPGVSPSDIEELVTKKIEKKVSGLKGIKKITSNSSNSFSTVTVEFEANEDLEDSLRKLRDKVNDLKSDLPKDANNPIVKEISFDDQPIWSIGLTGPYNGLNLREYGEEIKDELEKISGVREVNISGGDELEYEIAYDPQKLIYYNLSADQANNLVRATNLVIPSGTYEGSKYNYPIKADARFYEIDQILKTPLLHTEDGAIIYLSDIATVQEKSIERASYSRLSIKGEPSQDAITIEIIKKTGDSITKIVDQAQKTIDEKLKSLPPGITYEEVTNLAKRIEDDFNQLSHDFLFTLVLVFGILFLTIGLKEAFVAGLAVPLVFFVTFGVMNLTGVSLNFLSLFSLILSLGLLVDDAIVVVSATKQYMRCGKFTPEEAVLLVLNDFKVVLTTTTLTTVWAFLPLLSSSGIMGQFLKSIPITVSVTLTSSLLIALMINHPLAAVLERIRMTRNLFLFIGLILIGAIIFLITLKNTIAFFFILIFISILFVMLRWYKKDGRNILIKNQDLFQKEWNDDELIKTKLKNQEKNENINFFSKLNHGFFHLDYFLPIYEKYLSQIIATKKSRFKSLIIIAILFIFAISLPVIGIVPTEFFPATDSDYVFINIEADSGLKISETDKIVKKAEEKLLKYPEILDFSTIVGKPSANGQVGVLRGSSHLASITLRLKNEDERNLKAYELTDIIRADFKNFKEAKIEIDSPRGGPPSGSAFEARIIGDNLQVLDKIAQDLEPVLNSIKGVVNTNISLKEAPADYSFTLNPSRMELYNLNAAFVGSALRLAISGTEITTIIKDGKEIKVNARFEKNKLPTLQAVQNIQILNLKNQPVFLKDVAKIELKPSVETITRIDQKRVVLLSSSVDGGTRPNEVVAEFQKKVQSNYKLPDEYSIVYGGENQENEESVLSIIRAMLIAGLLIVATLIIQFNSFRKAMIVLATIPLALIGVFLGMAIFQVTLSFPGLIGILALFGIVVKNAIILVDKMNLNLKSNIPFEEAIIDAGKSRLEAIFITSICTIFGILPVTLTNEMWMALGSAVIFGLIVSSFLTLFIVPILFVVLLKKKTAIIK